MTAKKDHSAARMRRWTRADQCILGCFATSGGLLANGCPPPSRVLPCSRSIGAALPWSVATAMRDRCEIQSTTDGERALERTDSFRSTVRDRHQAATGGERRGCLTSRGSAVRARHRPWLNRALSSKRRGPSRGSFRLVGRIRGRLGAQGSRGTSTFTRKRERGERQASVSRCTAPAQAPVRAGRCGLPASHPGYPRQAGRWRGPSAGSRTFPSGAASGQPRLRPASARVPRMDRVHTPDRDAHTGRRAVHKIATGRSSKRCPHAGLG
jgi:hypothetical protein